MIWLLTPPLSPTLQSLALPATYSKTENERRLAGGRGGGRSQIMRRPESLVLYNTLNTLLSEQKNAGDQSLL
jgi:hypothetical protein